jgi:APA family basic amino acid/polyamine antiporter
VPVWATIVLGASSIVLVWSGSFLDLLNYTSVGLAAISALVVASVFPVRRRNVPGAYRMPLYPLPPLLYLGLIVGTVTQQVLDEKQRVAALLSLATIAVGVPLAWFFTRRAAGSAR